MYCPQCGQERISEQTNFCSRCGFLLTGVSHLISNGGELPATGQSSTSSSPSDRVRGLKQGLFIFLLTFLVVPIVAIISISLNIEPWAVAISSIILFVGGILRMVYALMFESAESTAASAGGAAPTASRLFSAHTSMSALPPQQSYPVSDYAPPSAGRWRETNDLKPSSVTESTTKLLENEERPQ